MRTIVFIVAMAWLAACSSNSGSVIDSYNTYKFDSTVIKQLPVYDSIANAITQNIQLFKRNTADGDDFHAYRYMPGADTTDGFSNLPAAVAPFINQQLSLLDSNSFQAFDVFKDSSIRFSIRYTLKNKIGTQENLSYFPPGKTVSRREPPNKDTVLNGRWLYWARFDKEGLF